MRVSLDGIYRYLLIFIVAAAIAVCAGCTVNIKAVRDPDFTGTVNRMFVLIKDDPQLEKGHSQNLHTAMTKELSDRGMDSIVRIMSSLELDESKFTREIEVFSPDAVLVIQKTGGTRSEQAILEIYWDASLFRLTPKGRIWRASIRTSGSALSIHMSEMAARLMNKLAEDRIIAPSPSHENQPRGVGQRIL